jgi:WD40 repeat protein
MMIVNRSLVTRILDNTITAFSSVVGGKVAVALEDKTLVVVDAVAGNSSVRHVQGLLRKKPSVVEFIAGKNDGLIVADRFGNVQEVDYTRGIGGGEESEEDEDQGVLVGHFGAVTDVKFSSDGKLLISADRDDRIRVSRWPEAYCIQSFCLGHTSYDLLLFEEKRC